MNYVYKRRKRISALQLAEYQEKLRPLSGASPR
jgi:hypothetical protein